MKGLCLTSLCILVLSASDTNAARGRSFKGALRLLSTTRSVGTSVTPKKIKKVTRLEALQQGLALIPLDDPKNETYHQLKDALDILEYEAVFNILSNMSQPEIPAVLKAAKPFRYHPDILQKMGELPDVERKSLGEALTPFLNHILLPDSFSEFIEAVLAQPPALRKPMVELLMELRTTDKSEYTVIFMNPSLFEGLLVKSDLKAIPQLKESEITGAILGSLRRVLGKGDQDILIETISKIPARDIPTVLKATAILMRETHTSQDKVAIVNQVKKVAVDERIKLSELSNTFTQNHGNRLLEVMQTLNNKSQHRRGIIVKALEPLMQYLPQDADIIGFIQEVDMVSTDPQLKVRAIALLLEERIKNKPLFSLICKKPSLLPVLLKEQEVRDLPDIELYHNLRGKKARRNKDDEGTVGKKQ